MKKLTLIICLTFFQIGNFHVVSDWCDDLPTGSLTESLVKTSIQTDSNGHSAENDLCGHCGHLGLNILQIAPSELDISLNQLRVNSFWTITRFSSNFTSPPTPPPLTLS